MARAAAILAAIGLLGLACGRRLDDGVAAVSDPIVGLWSTQSLFEGNLWVGYTPDGQVAYILDPSKPPGTLGNLDVINAVYQSTGRWNREGPVYKVLMSRGGRELGEKFYKIEGARLSECGQDGVPKIGGEEWARKLPGDAKTIEFITAYIKTMREANEGK